MMKNKFVSICVLVILSTLLCVPCPASDKPFYVLDSDPGLDDLFALFVFVKGGGEPDACISCYGNKPLSMTHRNLLLIQKYLGFKCKVFAGASTPLNGKPFSEGDFHGSDGLAGIRELAMKMLQMEDPGDPVAVAPKTIASELMKHDNIVYVSFGPLTNLARLLDAEPQLKKRISKGCLMGGGLKVFNKEHQTEFNFLADPEAVKKVFASGLDITIFPLDFTHKYPLQKAQLNALAGLDKYKHPVLVMCLYRSYLSCLIYNDNAGGAILHDAFTVLYVLNPGEFTITDKHLTVDEWGHIEENPNGALIHVCTDTRPDILYQALKKGLSNP